MKQENSESQNDGSENIHSESTRGHGKLDLNSIATIGAVILSLVAISISVIEVSTMRTQQRAAVWPYLQINGSYSANTYQIFLENKGVGPALIRDFALTVNNKLVNDVDQMVIDIVGEKNAFSYNVYKVSNPNNSVISSREKITLFSVPLRVKSSTNSNELVEYTPGVLFTQNARTSLNISICYCSIHEDCWLTQLSSAIVEPVEACEVKRQ